LALWGWSLPRAEQEAKYRSYWLESPLQAYMRGTLDIGEELNACYNGAKIAVHLGDTGLMDQVMLNGIAAGTLTLVRRCPDIAGPDGIGSYFELDKELMTFDSPKDLVQKVRYYLEHESKRRELADKARLKAVTQYSIKEQCRIMLDELSKR
jgi:spore maturation protein CgeB